MKTFIISHKWERPCFYLWPGGKTTPQSFLINFSIADNEKCFGFLWIRKISAVNRGGGTSRSTVVSRCAYMIFALIFVRHSLNLTLHTIKDIVIWRVKRPDVRCDVVAEIFRQPTLGATIVRHGAVSCCQILGVSKATIWSRAALPP